MRDRSAVNTLRGYFYQFDYTILQILGLKNNTDKITVEDIEDVDVSESDTKTAIQCKYYEGTEYNHSKISEAIRYLLYDFAERKNKNENQIHYMIYGYYLSGQEKLPGTIDSTFLKQNFLIHKHKIEGSNQFEVIEEDKRLNLSNSDLNSFINLLKIDINAQSFDDQLNSVYRIITDTFDCSSFEAEYYYYNNAINTIKTISVQKDKNNREISKSDFLKHINKKDLLFNKWFYLFREEKEVFKKIRKEYFTLYNISPYERFFLIDIEKSNFDIVTIKEIIYLIIQKWSKCSKRESKPFCPYLYFNNITESQISIIKKELYKESIAFCDGYPFYMSDFYPKLLALPTTQENKVCIKFINKIEMVDMVINEINNYVEIYQFYQNNVFFESSLNVRHVKIQIKKIENIKEII